MLYSKKLFVKNHYVCLYILSLMYSTLLYSFRQDVEIQTRMQHGVLTNPHLPGRGTI